MRGEVVYAEHQAIITYYFMKLLYFILLTLISSCITPSLHSFFDDEYADSLILFSDPEEALKRDDLFFRSTAINNHAEDLVNLLTSPEINLQSFLLVNIYKRTSPPVIVPLADAPFLYGTEPQLQSSAYSFVKRPSIPSCYDYARLYETWCKNIFFQGFLFYNETDKMRFNKTDPEIQAVINFDRDLIELIDDAIEIEAERMYDIPETLSLFKFMRLQERRAGLHMQGGYFGENWNLQANIPFYYLEHNFYLTPEEQIAVENSRLVQRLSPQAPSSSAAAQEFLRDYLVADRIGIGDLAVSIEYALQNSDNFTMDVGLHARFPLAKTFKRGLLGGSFDYAPQQPIIDLNHILELVIEGDIERATAIGTEYALAGITRLTRIFADHPMGDEFFWFGPSISSVINTQNPNQYLYLYGHVLYGAPRRRIRFYTLDISPDQLLNRDYENAELADENLAFLTKSIVARLYPVGFMTEINPGFQAHGIASWNYVAPGKKITFGLDTWFKTAESYSLTRNIQSFAPINFAPAERVAGLRFSLFASVGFTHYEIASIPLSMTLHAFGSPIGRGVGSDVTIAFELGAVW